MAYQNPGWATPDEWNTNSYWQASAPTHGNDPSKGTFGRLQAGMPSYNMGAPSNILYSRDTIMSNAARMRGAQQRQMQSLYDLATTGKGSMAMDQARRQGAAQQAAIGAAAGGAMRGRYDPRTARQAQGAQGAAGQGAARAGAIGQAKEQQQAARLYQQVANQAMMGRLGTEKTAAGYAGLQLQDRFAGAKHRAARDALIKDASWQRYRQKMAEEAADTDLWASGIEAFGSVLGGIGGTSDRRQKTDVERGEADVDAFLAAARGR